MIIVAGSATEPPVRRLLDEAWAMGLETVLLEEERAAAWELEVEVVGGRIRAFAVSAGARVDLTSATGLYLRLTAPRVAGPRPDPLEAARHTAAISLLSAWADVAELRVANRPSAMASNGSKPYQGALIHRAGFAVPETLVTTDPDAVRDFRRRHGRIVYKSSSGVRSIVHELAGPRVAELDRVRALPTQFQRLLRGSNVRVHVVGSDVHACEVESATIDYRYAEGGEVATMWAVELPEEIRARCLAVSRALQLPLAGIDLLRDDDGQWWCFEVNPSPAYTCFEEPTGLPIARSLARWWAGVDGS